MSRRAAVWELFRGFYRRALLAIAQLIERGQRAGSIESTLNVAAAAPVIVELAHMIVQMKFSGSTRGEITHTIQSLLRGYLVGHGAAAVSPATPARRTLRT